MVGVSIGTWTVVKMARKSKAGEYYWTCTCSCGNVSDVGGKSLRNGHSLGCSDCRYKKIANAKYNRKHGMTGSKEYSLWQSAKARASKLGLEFNLDLEDIQIPKYCPLLGTEILSGTGKPKASSPSLDRLNSSKGYVKGNVWVISFRANAIKQDASLAELELLVKNLKQRINC